MKKFTRNFLLGEHSILRFLRNVGLGLGLVLWTTLAFAQEAQDTYHIKVNTMDSVCYRTDNIYEVPVTMRDFMKIKEFVLVLNYTNTTDFDFIGLKNLNSAISNMKVEQLTDGNLTFTWESDDPVSILPDNSENTMFVLKFKLAAFQHQYLTASQFVFTSALTWKQVDLYNDRDEQCEILTSQIINNTLKVYEKWRSVVVDSGIANCWGGITTATVTTPAHVSGMQYSFNGQDYNPTNISEVKAPSTDNTLVIKDATCISYIEKFDVSAVKALWFKSDTKVYTNCPGGLGDIEILAYDGTKPYTYYVIPEEQWSAGDKMEDKLENVVPNWETLLNKYKYSNYVIQVPAGTEENPKVYHVAVQDANNCAAITGTNLGSWWKPVEVIDKKDPWDVELNLELTRLMTTCWGQPDGRIVFDIDGGTPWKNAGYNVAVDGMYVGKMFTYDSNVNVLCDGKPCNHAVLEPGCYNFVITDSLGCSTTAQYCVSEPKKIKFEVDHTDAGCGQPVGELSILSVDASTGSGPTSTWRWQYTTDPTWATASEWFALTTEVTDLPAGVYYVRVKDGNSCIQEWTNATGDNAVKILTTVFDYDFDEIKCNGDLTNFYIKLISGDANHEFAYMAEEWVCTTVSQTTVCDYVTVGSGWQSGNMLNGHKFTGIKGDVKYRYSVWDKTADCMVPFQYMIDNPPVLEAEVLTWDSKMPTCPGDNNGIFYVKVKGGRPWANESYEFQIDNDPEWRKTNYFLVGAGEHTINVRDAAGCPTVVKLNITPGENKIDFVDK